MEKKTTEAQRKAIEKYQTEKTDLIRIRVDKGKKDEFMAHAEKQGKSLTAYIVEAVEQKIENDKGEEISYRWIRLSFCFIFF